MFSAAIRRGLIEARVALQIAYGDRRAFSAAIRRGLIEADALRAHRRRHVDCFPRRFAAASLKRKYA